MATEKAPYKSPIEIFINDVNYSMEQAVLVAVSKVGINVNKDELIKALTYDRQQYEEGYRNAMKQMPKWIPVSERLPENMNRVLIAKRIIDEETVVDIGWYFAGEKTWYTNEFVVADVVAWMPLPDCYVEEQKCTDSKEEMK